MKSSIRQLFLFLTPFVCMHYAGSHAAFAEEFTYAFRGSRWDEKMFRPTGPNTLRALQVDSGGLRITLGSSRTNSVPVGLCTRFGVRGDFEISMTFEILRIDKPPRGNGAGASIWVSMASSTRDAAGVARLVRPGGEQAFTTFWAKTPVGQKREYYGGKSLSAQTQSGKLRLVRKGAELTFLIAQSPTSAFQELYKSDWGTDDLDIVRFAAEDGGSPALVDVRIKDVRIRADDFGAAISAPPQSRRAAMWWMTGALIVLGAAVGFWWRQRHSG
jgi:Protein of unknown function (DUF1583)